MHLWPSMRIRDSFKINYLKKLEWNLHRMNSEKRSQSASGNDDNNRQRLLDDHHDTEQQRGVVDGEIQENKPIPAIPSSLEKAALICREILMILSCCYCCFCCGACGEDDV